jgi:hypothetical protein
MTRQIPMPLLILAALTALLLLPSSAYGTWREIRSEIPVAAGQRIRLDFSVAELEVLGHDGRNVVVEIEARCRWSRDDCEEGLEDLRIDTDTTDRKLIVELEGLPRWFKEKIEIEGTIRVPKGQALEIDLGVGEIRVEGMASDLRIELGVGEVDVRMSRDVVSRITLDAGVGEANLFGDDATHQGRRSLFVGSEVSWDEGGGEARIDIEVGVGEIVVLLD